MGNIIKRGLFALSDKLNSGKMFKAIKNGFIMTIPIVLIGAISIVILNFPIEAYQKFIESFANGIIIDIFTIIFNNTLGILSLILVMTISYSYSRLYSMDLKNKNNLQLIPIISIICYMIISGVFGDDFNLSEFNSEGIFTAIITAILSSKLYILLINFNKKKYGVCTFGINGVLEGVINGLIPSIITVFSFAIFQRIIFICLNYSNLQSLIADGIRYIYSGASGTLGSAIIYILLIHVLWCFGMQGNNILEVVANNIFIDEVYANTNNYILTGVTSSDILNRSFLSSFVYIGGTGAILSLVIALLIYSKKKNIKVIGKLGLLPSIFNVSEIVVFGVPVVLNPIFIIPFIFSSIANLLISYFLMYIGIVPLVTHSVSWTTPIIISGYVTTESILGALLQIILLIVGVFIYRPFVKWHEEKYDINVCKNVNALRDELIITEQNQLAADFISRNDELGATARMLANDLKIAIKEHKLFMVYQPQVDKDNKFIGAEALLRWKHEIAGFIYPPLIIEIATEANILSELEENIFKEVGQKIKIMNEQVSENIKISVNVTAHSLLNEKFEDMVNRTISDSHIRNKNLWIEITEQDALTSTVVIDKLKKLKDNGHQLLIDDFGMGHTSITYLKTNQFDVVKLDGCITKDILTNTRNAEIISSIVYLSKSLKFSIICEFVETEKQRDRLIELGCSIFQGYLYSKPLPFEEVLEIIKENGVENFPLRRD